MYVRDDDDEKMNVIYIRCAVCALALTQRACMCVCEYETERLVLLFFISR